MSEQSVDVVIRARQLTQQACDAVSKAMKTLEDQAQTSGKGLSSGLGADLRQVEQDAGRASSALGGLRGVATTAIGSMVGFAAATVGLRGVGDLFGALKTAAIGMNATLETSTLQFTTL